MKRVITLVALASWLMTSLVSAQSPAPLSALAKMPVKEVTIFKDGHAFVLHEGKMPTDGAGNVLMDYLPTPVLGTFWPYSADKNIKLTSVVASERKVLIERTALRLIEMLDANRGAEVILTEKPAYMEKPVPYVATLVGIPRRSSQELEATSPPNAGEKLPQKGDVIILKTSDGTKVLPLERIQDVTFKNEPKPTVGEEEFRNLLTLKLDWLGRNAAKTAEVGLVYLQRGLRWIPSYKITLDNQGNANVKLQATLINELADLEDVTANLVIGVPTFAFKETLDPISLQKEATPLSGYFQQSDRSQLMTQNAIMTQTARMGERRANSISDQPTGDLGPEVTDATQNEDLYLFTVTHITLKKGQRMALPVADYTVKYKDIYTVDLPFSPPTDVRMNLNSEQQAEIARLLNAPKATHKIRLTNSSNAPLTTAPALIVKDDRVLAQGMMTYTSVGGNVDLEITRAVDIQVAKSESETARTPNATRLNGDTYTRVDLNGSVKLTNYRKETADIEVTRYVLGNVTSATHNGEVRKINVMESDRYTPIGNYPSWWGWYSWPAWWSQLNGIGRVSWKVNLEAGKSVDLNYNWNYFWR
ncbi:MAG: hypothetical protein HY231_04760 [Acidobacteria bacterium]|nr:hypothetical protein [Acidobacteriota bacterium]